MIKAKVVIKRISGNPGTRLASNLDIDKAPRGSAVSKAKSVMLIVVDVQKRRGSSGASSAWEGAGLMDTARVR